MCSSVSSCSGRDVFPRVYTSSSAARYLREAPESEIDQSTEEDASKPLSETAQVAPGYLGRWSIGRMVTFALDIIIAFVPFLFLRKHLLLLVKIFTDECHSARQSSILSQQKANILQWSGGVGDYVAGSEDFSDRFPIMGKFFRTIGLWWAEYGIKLGYANFSTLNGWALTYIKILERLIGSQTLFAAVER